MNDPYDWDVFRYLPIGRPIPEGWELIEGALEDTHHGAHARLIRQIKDKPLCASSGQDSVSSP